jgi:hypothetical protein
MHFRNSFLAFFIKLPFFKFETLLHPIIFCDQWNHCANCYGKETFTNDLRKTSLSEVAKVAWNLEDERNPATEEEQLEGMISGWEIDHPPMGKSVMILLKQ